MTIRIARVLKTQTLAWGALSAVLALSAAPARADVLNVSALDQFNLIVFGSVSSNSEVEGRALIGGALSGTSNYFTHGTNAAASSYAALTVGGSQAGTVNINDGGNVVIAGSAGSINLNGGGSGVVGGAIAGTNNSHIAQYQTVPALPDFKSSALSLSTSLDHLAANSTLSQPDQNTSIFTAHPNASGVAVFDITGAELARGTPSFVLNGATSIIINVDAATLTLSNNFNDASLGGDLLWNFYDATSLTFGTEFGGTVLAPLAGVINNGPIDGTLIASSLIQNGEIHLDNYQGTLPGSTPLLSPGPANVPEPSTLALFGAGLLGLLALAGRRRRA